MYANRTKIVFLTSALCAAVVTASACGSMRNDGKIGTKAVKPSVQYRGYIEQQPVTDSSGKTWVPLEPAAKSLGYRVEEESGDGYAKIGFSDVMYRVRPGSASAFSLGEGCTLPEAPKRQNGKIYMTTEALSKLFHTQVSWSPGSGEISIVPPKEPDTVGQQKSAKSDKPFRIQSLSSSESDELISFSKKYLGVPYEFGAAPYEESKTFDCSSFTRHVFKKFGVDLPRLARDQDNVGRSVSRQQLAPGDLIFFTVPGRFDKDTIPGHVGIYIGGGEFIHTWGDPGVQISKLDSGYWSNVILHMRRVL
ncbi:cell wall-associated NlpC family hydrolase [Paenibacillus forsythiae]|uniref:Cell wall-associated NlpC family hydrolase n=1 Tax=Paenibacillus forsythiae TaxID=365616 RepID=A0ABU3H460_9BACL|nr:NlpC/P60 family protein [Paenibacillus forsythiae]MDT3425619.1 cell wall-associated NlpC family hydrolase [Paenibacillus forsythiae]